MCRGTAMAVPRPAMALPSLPTAGHGRSRHCRGRLNDNSSTVALGVRVRVEVAAALPCLAVALPWYVCHGCCHGLPRPAASLPWLAVASLTVVAGHGGPRHCRGVPWAVPRPATAGHMDNRFDSKNTKNTLQAGSDKKTQIYSPRFSHVVFASH